MPRSNVEGIANEFKHEQFACLSVLEFTASSSVSMPAAEYACRCTKRCKPFAKVPD